MAIILALLASVGPFSIDTYLPSFNDIARSLGATSVEVQQTLTAYLVPFALMTLWHGAISDAVGRRRVILVALALFGLASFGCVFAQRIEHLWVLRALQGMTAGAGIVVCRAIVRDLYEGSAARRLIAQVTMMFALAPALGPVLGGWLQAWFGWRSVFVFLSLLSGLLWLICWLLLPETLPQQQRQPLKVGYLLATYRRVLTSPSFLLVCGALALNFAAFFIYVLSAPVFLIEHLGVSVTGFLWLFGPAMGGLMAGAWLSGRLAERITATRSIALGYLTMALAAAANVLLNVLAPPVLPWSVIPIFGFTFGMSFAMPSLTLVALDLFPEQRGLAASCQTFLQSGCNAVAAGVIAPALWGSTTTLALGMGGLLLLGAFAVVMHQLRSNV
ncbi:MAG TPA: multidrug effflux MFS transporter [Accumulibacter sp.]|uniref:multidrug effflux MFS transporter n=1 Tax=Accumulibacter sp. TaxID=2053492 RepID=UPI002629B601|nr:multidrug effflux MFS transporter [Accumulibacter sp.]HNB68440.1 multidrug effflux MFS transporter [Accumulibacter sp.]HNC27438.1 multidrug effflux MFS transporter [Accumulibacter sp.]HNI51734.1 multidrug effflux MFS transporter [Accumulibacter sp.]HNJ51654.1 multidrug effflux MFS transporter [Accumulibacter sp.]HNK04166.1 multidrug effflux MFS transporter [Accumulibacter sp.]